MSIQLSKYIYRLTLGAAGLMYLIAPSIVNAAPCSSVSSPYTSDCDASNVNWTTGDLTVNPNVTLLDTANLIFSATNGNFINNGTINNTRNGDIALMLGSSSPAKTINSVTNNNSITGGQSAIQTFNNTTIGTLTNNGSLNAQYGLFLQNYSIVDTIANTGSMNAIKLDSNVSVNTITNTGSIVGANGIYNPLNMMSGPSGSIGTLNNLQGGNSLNSSTTALTYNGSLPTNYNMIISSPTHYGQLFVTSPNGSTTFGISSLSNSNIGAAGTRYLNVLTGLTVSNIDNENTVLTYRNGNLSASYELVTNGVTNAWDLLILSMINGASAIDTQASLHSLAPNLRNAFNAQTVSSNFANMNTYDCNLFDTKGICMSVGGQQTYIENPSSNITSTVVVAGYKVSPHIRIGGFLNQNINNNTVSSVYISNKNPLMGVFGVWNRNEDGLGYQVKLANAYQDKDISTTREVIGSSEAGKGSTNLNTQSYVAEVSYALKFNDKTIVRPYVALRSTTIQQDGYTEDSSVSAPLTYSAITDRSLTTLLGIKLNHALTSKVSLTGSLGIEQDLEHHVDNLTATGVSGLTSENFNDSIKRTRPVASAGASFTPSKKQRISGELFYQQLPFQSTGSTTAYVNYAIGF
jgi:uncharacterized protein YhjY with autotransporter beta-barrel domain